MLKKCMSLFSILVFYASIGISHGLSDTSYYNQSTVKTNVWRISQVRLDYNNDGAIDAIETDTFNKDGNYLQDEDIKWNNQISYYTYDETGRIQQKKIDKQRDGTIDELTAFAYDDFGNMTESHTIYGSGYNQTKIKYTYDASGNCIEKSRYAYHLIDGQLDQGQLKAHKIYTYNARNLPTQIIRTRNAEVTRITLEYDASDNITARQTDHGDDGQIDSSVELTFNASGEITGFQYTGHQSYAGNFCYESAPEKKHDWSFETERWNYEWEKMILSPRAFKAFRYWSKSENDTNGDGLIDEVSHYTFNENDLIEKIEYDTDNDGITDAVDYYTWIFDGSEPAELQAISPSGVVTEINPAFQWHKDPSATWYELFAWDSSKTAIHSKWYKSSDICAESNCSVTIGTALKDGSYKWWVRGWNSFGYGAWNTGINFTVTGSDSCADTPAAATLSGPFGTIAQTQPLFTWNENTCASWYKLLVWNNNKTEVHDQWYKSTDVCFQGICSVAVNSQLTGGDYQWWIRGWNEFGNGPWSRGKTFTINAPALALPSAAILKSPDHTVSDPVTFTWNAAAAASWYYLWVDDSTGTKVKKWYTAREAGCESGTGTCSVTPDISVPMAPGTCTWWVQTYNDRGYGPWSRGLNFSVSE